MISFIFDLLTVAFAILSIVSAFEYFTTSHGIYILASVILVGITGLLAKKAPNSRI